MKLKIENQKSKIGDLKLEIQELAGMGQMGQRRQMGAGMQPTKWTKVERRGRDVKMQAAEGYGRLRKGIFKKRGRGLSKTMNGDEWR